MPKPSILLLHGALGSGLQLEPLANALEADFKPLIYTFPGHGEKPGKANWTLNSLAEELLHFHSEPLFVFGYSMGGYAALMAEKQRPGFLKGLVTLGTKFDWSTTATEREVKKLDSDFLSAKAPDFVDELKRLHGPDRWKDLLAESAQMMRELSTGGALSDLDFQQISSPVFLCLASGDRMVSLAETEAVQRLLPRASMWAIEGAHGLSTVNAHTLAARIKQGFLSI